MLQGKHSAILSTFIKLPFVIKIFVLSIFEWPFNTGFTVQNYYLAVIDSHKINTQLHTETVAEQLTDISVNRPEKVVKSNCYH